MNKKNVKTYLLIIVSIFTTIAIIDNLNMSDRAEELKEENNQLNKQVENVERLKEENKKLKEENTGLKQEVQNLNSPVKHQDVVDSIHAVDELLSFVIKDRESCPCIFFFNNQQYEWSHQSFMEPYEFKFQHEKLYLTYESPEYYDYQFVVAQYTGNDGLKKWGVEKIKYTEKEN